MEIEFDDMIPDPRYNQWFINNLRCSRGMFCALVSTLRVYMSDYKFRKSTHSFAKKIAILLYFLASEGGYRETGGTLGVSKSWCIYIVPAFSNDPAGGGVASCVGGGVVARGVDAAFLVAAFLVTLCCTGGLVVVFDAHRAARPVIVR